MSKLARLLGGTRLIFQDQVVEEFPKATSNLSFSMVSKSM